MESNSLVLSIVSIINMIVLGVLIYIFGKMYVKTRAQLPLGMIVVAGMLFLHNVIGAFAYFSMDQIFSYEIFPYMLGVGIAELAGLLIFLKITLDQFNCGYQLIILCYKNILIVIAASIIISAITAHLLSDQVDYLNTTYTLLVDYVVYFSTFGGLYYLDNRKKYLLESDKSKLKHDLIKIITSLGIAEVAYTIARWFLQYYFLNINYDAYLASIISQIISMIICLVVINLSVKMTRLYKDEN